MSGALVGAMDSVETGTGGVRFRLPHPTGQNVDQIIRNAVSHFVAFALRPGPFWKLPPALDRLLGEAARGAMGQAWWDDPLQRERLDAAFDALARDGGGRTPPAMTKDLVDAATFGLLPLHFPKTAELLLALWRRRDFPETVRILDVASGPGTASLSAVYFFSLLAHARRLYGDAGARYKLQIMHLDSSPAALETAKRLVSSFMSDSGVVAVELVGQMHASVEPEPGAEDSRLAGNPFDLVLVQNLFGSLRRHAVAKRKDILLRMAAWLRPEGSLLLVDPSSGGRAQEFHQIVSKSIEDGGLHLYAPCHAIFGEPCGVSCYACSGSQQRGITRPRFLEHLCKAASRYDFEALSTGNTWSWAILRREPGSLSPVPPGGAEGYNQLGSLFDGPGGGRVNVLAAVASVDPTRVGVYKLCDQSCGAESCALQIPAGYPAPPLDCGDVLALQNVVVERHEDPDEGTVRFVLHVDGESAVMSVTGYERQVLWPAALERLAPHV